MGSVDGEGECGSVAADHIQKRTAQAQFVQFAQQIFHIAAHFGQRGGEIARVGGRLAGDIRSVKLIGGEVPELFANRPGFIAQPVIIHHAENQGFEVVQFQPSEALGFAFFDAFVDGDSEAGGGIGFGRGAGRVVLGWWRGVDRWQAERLVLHRELAKNQLLGRSGLIRKESLHASSSLWRIRKRIANAAELRADGRYLVKNASCL